MENNMFTFARVLQKVLLCTPLDKHVTGLRVREYFCVNIVALAKDNASNKCMFVVYFRNKRKCITKCYAILPKKAILLQK